MVPISAAVTRTEKKGKSVIVVGASLVPATVSEILNHARLLPEKILSDYFRARFPMGGVREQRSDSVTICSMNGLLITAPLSARTVCKAGTIMGDLYLLRTDATQTVLDLLKEILTYGRAVEVPALTAGEIVQFLAIKGQLGFEWTV
jgi:hypothetical protein